MTVLNTEDNQFSWWQGIGNWGGSNPPGTGSTEWLNNNGGKGMIRVKGHEDVSALKFNLSSYRGQRVVAAELHLARSSTDKVFAMAAATINTSWSDVYGNGAPVAGAPCWRWRSTPSNYTSNNNATRSWIANEWTFPRSDFSTASFGNFGSLTCFGAGNANADAADAPNYGINHNDTFRQYVVGSQTWVAMKIDPSLIHAMILDQPGGLVVTDSRQHGLGNPTVYSANQNSSVQPRLFIQLAAGDTNPPTAVGDLSAAGGMDNGNVVLAFTAPSDAEDTKAFGYNVRYSMTNNFATATDLDRWRIPRPKIPGKQQSVLIENLTPGTTYYFFVQPYDSVGNYGPVASVQFAVPAAVPTPMLADGGLATPNPAGKSVRQDPAGKMKWFAASEVVKINPNSTGYVYGGAGNDDYKKANMVWDSGTNTISLLGCRNEMVGAQLMLGRIGTSLNGVNVAVSDLTGPGGAIIPSSPNIELFMMHYVGSTGAKHPEAAIPLAAPFPTTLNIPDANRNAGGYWQSVYMDIYVPQTVNPGDYTGTVTVTATGMSAVTINLALRVSAVMIPDTPTFLLDYNGYGNPWDFSTSPWDDICQKYFQVVHKHRGVPNTLPYNWSGVTQTDRRPNVTGNGPTRFATTWTSFDSKYGRFFTSNPATSAFTAAAGYTGPGANTPVTHFYTTFNECWPEHMIDATYGFDAGGKGPTYWDNLLVAHNYSQLFTECPDPWIGFGPGYQQANKNLIADWVQHAHNNGWTKTAFQIYLNNKYEYIEQGRTYALWTMEENESADDFRVDGFLHQMWRDGYAASGVTDVPWHFRIDISDRWGQHWGELDNRINWWMMGSGAADWHWPHIKYRPHFIDKDKPEEWMTYGGGAGWSSDGYANAEHVLRRWSEGFNGVVPWWDCYRMSWTEIVNGQTVNCSSWVDGQDLALIYSGQSVPGVGTYRGAFVSIRLKQMRQVQQIVELLNMWSNQPGLNRHRVRDALFARYGDGSTHDYRFSTLDENKVYKLRADLIRQLEGTPPTEPSNPSPADGQMDVPTSAALSWVGAASGVTFDVYLDLVDPPVTKVASGLSAATFTPAPADDGRIYYWRVVATNSGGETSGPTWVFASHLTADTNGDGAVNVADLQSLVMAWADGPGYSGPEDMNSDGYVNVGDLQILVANWGRYIY